MHPQGGAAATRLRLAVCSARRGAGLHTRAAPTAVRMHGQGGTRHARLQRNCRQLLRRAAKGTWCSGITSAPHVEGPGFKSQCVQICTGCAIFDGAKSEGLPQDPKLMRRLAYAPAISCLRFSNALDSVCILVLTGTCATSGLGTSGLKTCGRSDSHDLGWHTREGGVIK